MIILYRMVLYSIKGEMNMKKGRLKSIIVIGLIMGAVMETTPVFADVYIINSIKKTTDSKSGVTTVREIQQLSDGSIKEILTQSDNLSEENTYYPDGSSIEKFYVDGELKGTDKGKPGEYSATYKALEESLNKKESNAIVKDGNKDLGSFSDLSNAIITDWQQNLDGSWYWMENGVPATGWRDIKNQKYYFDFDGKMHTGWLQYGNEWFYFLPNGDMIDGRFKINGTWYSFSRGRMQLNGSGDSIFSLDGSASKEYYYDSTGACTNVDDDFIKSATGLRELYGHLYYFNSDSQPQIGWLKVNGYWYFFDQNGIAVRSTTKVIDGKSYTFGVSGALV